MIAGRKFVATVNGVMSSKRSTRASALVESSSITDIPGSIIARACRASAAFSVCAVFSRYATLLSNTLVGCALTPPRYLRTTPCRSSSSRSRCTVITLTPNASTRSLAETEPCSTT